MQAAVELMSHVLGTELAHGKYIGLFCISLFVLWGYGKKDMLRYGLISSLLAIFPVFVFLFVNRLQISANYWEMLWCVPITLVIAYGGTLILEERRGRETYFVLAGMMLLIACSGTVLPYKADVMKIKYADEQVETAIEVVARQQEVLGENVKLLAPEEIMADARRRDGNIALLYGKDLWNSNLKTGVADPYTPDLYVLYERMKTDYLYPSEMAEQALWYGCNVVVLREKIPEESEQYEKWQLAESIPGYLIYRISK